MGEVDFFRAYRGLDIIPLTPNLSDEFESLSSVLRIDNSAGRYSRDPLAGIIERIGTRAKKDRRQYRQNSHAGRTRCPAGDDLQGCNQAL